MRSKITTVAIALALVGAFVAPASAAQAASATVSGTVEYHGAPVAKILVGWFVPTTGAYKAVTSATDGSYSLALPAAGTKYVLFGNMKMENVKQTRGNTRYVGTFYGEGDERDYAFQTVEPYVATGDADVVDIPLAKPGAINGKDSRLKGHFVQLKNLGGFSTPMFTEAGYQGAFTIKNLVPGQYRLNQPHYEDYVSVTDEIITVAEGETTTIDPKTVKGGRIEGVVTDSKGKPIKDVLVSVTATGKDSLPSVRTDSTGFYRLAGLESGTYRVHYGNEGESGSGSFGAKGYVERSRVAPAVTVGTTVSQNISLSRGGRIIVTLKKTSNDSENVRLVGPEGETIWASDNIYGTSSASYGSLASGTYKVYTWSTTKLRSSATTVKVTANKTYDLGTPKQNKKAFVLKGHLAGSGIAEQHYIFATSSQGFGYVGYANANGDYRIPGMIPGKYTIEAVAPGYSVGNHTVTMTKNLTRDFARGAKYGKVSVGFTTAGAPVRSARLIMLKDSRDQLDGTMVGGRIVASAPAGKYDETDYFTVEDQFQAKSPYWAEIPASSLPFQLKSGTTANLGVIPLIVHGSLLP